MGLHSDKSAILSAVIFNALIIIALIPLALKGVAYRPVGAAALLRRNLAIYGLGGIIAPFIGIKIIDVLVSRPASGLRSHAMLSQIRPAIVLLVLFSALTGLVYPLAITGVAQARAACARPTAAWSSRSAQAGRLGADRPELRRRQIFPFGRPSATQAQDPAHPDDPSKTIDAPYNAANSTGSNLGPTSQKLIDRVKADVDGQARGRLERRRFPPTR